MDPPADSSPSMTRTEGPPPGLASGRFDAPRWAIASLGAVIALAAFGYLLARRRRARRAAVAS
jgi:hypothetical protein